MSRTLAAIDKDCAVLARAIENELRRESLSTALIYKAKLDGYLDERIEAAREEA